MARVEYAFAEVKKLLRCWNFCVCYILRFLKPDATLFGDETYFSLFVIQLRSSQ